MAENEVEAKFEEWRRKLGLEDVKLRVVKGLKMPGVFVSGLNEVLLDLEEMERQKRGLEETIAHELCHAYVQINEIVLPCPDEVLCQAYGKLAAGMQPKPASPESEETYSNVFKTIALTSPQQAHGVALLYIMNLLIPSNPGNPLYRLKDKYIEFYSKFPNIDEMIPPLRQIISKAQKIADEFRGQGYSPLAIPAVAKEDYNLNLLFAALPVAIVMAPAVISIIRELAK